MTTRDPTKTLRKSTDAGFREESPPGISRYGRPPIQMSKPTSETVFGYANVSQGAQYHTNLNKT